MADHATSRRTAQTQSSPLTRLWQWVQKKNYQYEVTMSLYMLNFTEKVILNVIFLTLISMFLTAAYLYLPNHLMIIAHRVYYYVMGEWSSINVSKGDAAEGLTNLITASSSMTVAQMAKTVESAVRITNEL